MRTLIAVAIVLTACGQEQPTAENAEALANKINDAELERMMRADFEREHPKPVVIPTIPREPPVRDTRSMDAFLAQQKEIEEERRISDLERRMHAIDEQ